MRGDKGRRGEAGMFVRKVRTQKVMETRQVGSDRLFVSNDVLLYF